MTWEELSKADPQELFEMSEKFVTQFQPIELDNSFTIGMAAHGNCLTTLFALRALFASVTGSFNLILVDDASPDETYSLLSLLRNIIQIQDCSALNEIRNIAEVSTPY